MQKPAHTAAPAVSVTDRAADLRQRGLRATRQRLAVLEAVAGAGHLLADEICRTIQQGNGPAADISLQSVYVVLGDLERAGLIRKVDLGTGSALFEAGVGDNHHHAVCRSCGRVEDVACSVGHAPCIDPSATSMRVEAAEVIFRGVCAECTAEELSPGAPGDTDSNQNGVNHD